MKKTILILAGLLFCVELAFSQGFYNKNRNRNLIFSVGTGTTHYYGDLAKSGDNSNIKPNLGLGARYNFYRWFSAGAEVTWFMLGGADKTDPGKETRNLSFQSHNFEISLVGQVSLFEEDRRFYMRPFANPYIYGGIGLVNYNPTAKLDGERYNLRKLNTSGESYGAFTASFPVGAGVKFRVNPFFNVVLDGGYRFVLSDHLDDVSSGVYPHPSTFGDNEVARKLSDRTWETLPDGTPTWAEQGKNFRGNPDDKDGYFIFNVKLEYYFGELGKTSTYRRKIKVQGNKRLKAPKRRTNRQINRRRF
ncbi:MAG: porin family protein [Cyclobacteriaceae bacterium]|nr:porin family protein [Cyclobacteriaceae bacterium]